MEKRPEYTKYFDWAATTPLDSTVASVIFNTMTDPLKFGNPSSTHLAGRRTAEILNNTRDYIRQLFRLSETSEVYFTSGGTEANALVINGFCGTVVHYLCSYTAHHSMRENIYRQTKAFFSTYGVDLFCDSNGIIDLDALDREMVKAKNYPGRVLICVEWVNNETGVIQPIDLICEMAHKVGAHVLVDAVQAIPYILANPMALELCSQIDYITFSAHKIFGPKGIGVVINNRSHRSLRAFLTGGSQEQGLRAGTQNVLGVVGLHEALLRQEGEASYGIGDLLSVNDKERLKKLVMLHNFKFNAPLELGIGNIFNLGLECESAYMVAMLSELGYMTSTGAACNGNSENSHVLQAMGKESDKGLRISFLPSINGWEELANLLDEIECIQNEFLKEG